MTDKPPEAPASASADAVAAAAAHVEEMGKPEAQKIPTPDPQWSCAHCKFYIGSVMTCIRFPPIPVPTGAVDPVTKEPVVSYMFSKLLPWGKCGEFKKRAKR